MDDIVWSALIASVKHAYNVALPDGGCIPPPALVPFSAGKMIGIVWLREVHQGQDALTGIREMSTLAATARADEVVMFWETEDIAVACRLPPLHQGNALNAVCATRAGHVVHRYPFTWHTVPGHSATGLPRCKIHWLPEETPLIEGKLEPAIQAVLTFSWQPFPSNDAAALYATAEWLRAHGHRVSLKA
jgi:hypothetical protein